MGPFRADILCKNTEDDSLVLIENQIERTDHKHLGQLLTYAAGLQSVTIVWVAAKFTEEHRAALDWLNEITDKKFRFFGLEVELWKIGNSAAAPKFNVISKPNNWSKTVSDAAKEIENQTTSETKKLQYRYWLELVDYLEEVKSSSSCLVFWDFLPNKFPRVKITIIAPAIAASRASKFAIIFFVLKVRVILSR